MLMFSIFTLTLTALVILKMPYALTLAVLAGFCEFIPAVGPLIAAIPGYSDWSYPKRNRLATNSSSGLLRYPMV